MKRQKALPDDGECNFETKTITIKAGLSERDEWTRFYHECFHAGLFEAHISSNDGWVSDHVEEILIDTLVDVVFEIEELKSKGKKVK